MGSAAARIPVAPGTYTVKLAASDQTLTQTVEVKPDPRWRAAGQARLSATAPAAPSADQRAEEVAYGRRIQELSEAWAKLNEELSTQQDLSLRVRDDISKLSDTVARLRAVKKQIALRKELLKDRDDTKELLKQSEALDKTLDGIEEKLHNPKAKISYDIFAQRGGAMLYSQLAWLLANLIDADGAPTKAQLELADELEKQLAMLVDQFEATAKDDVGKLNEAAKKLGVPELYVPPAKKK
jgi:hypothetical protein